MDLIGRYRKEAWNLSTQWTKADKIEDARLALAESKRFAKMEKDLDDQNKDSRIVTVPPSEITEGNLSDKEKNPEELGFKEWVEKVTFVVDSSGSTFKYREGTMVVTSVSGQNENNKAKLRKADLKIEFEANVGPAYIQVKPDRQRAVYVLKSNVAAKLRVIGLKE